MASRAITLFLLGTGVCATSYEASQRNSSYDDGDAITSTQSSSRYNPGYGSGYNSGYGVTHHWYNSFFHTGGYSSSSSYHSSTSHSSSTSRGGFGSTAHAHASSSS